MLHAAAAVAFTLYMSDSECAEARSTTNLNLTTNRRHRHYRNGPPPSSLILKTLTRRDHPGPQSTRSFISMAVIVHPLTSSLDTARSLLALEKPQDVYHLDACSTSQVSVPQTSESPH